MLANIDIIGGSIILMLTMIIYAVILLGKDKLKITKDKIFIFIIGIIANIIITKSTIGTAKTLLLSLLYIIQIRYMFKIKYSNAILQVFVYIIMSMIPDALFLLFVLVILKIPPEICYSQIAERVSTTAIVSILLLVIVYILRKPLRKIVNVKINLNKELVAYTILTLGCVLVVFYNATADIKIISENLLVSIIIMIVFVVILYSLIKQRVENVKVIERYDKLLEFIKKYEVVIEEEKELRHESKNQLITIKSKIVNKEKEKYILEYVDSILKDHKNYKEDKYGKFQYLPANGIKGLFYYKTMEAEEKGIKISINIGKRVEDSVLSKLTTEDFKQLGRMVGVYLDNAIEASRESKEKKLGIEIYLQEEDIIMIITNTYSGEIDEESIGKVKYTTKGKNHGYGLMLVNKILIGTNRFKAEKKITDKLYIQKLIVKNY